jgi:hypothetical protein
MNETAIERTAGQRTLRDIAAGSLESARQHMLRLGAKIEAAKAIKGKKNRRVAKARLAEELRAVKNNVAVMERLEQRVRAGHP